MRSKKMKELIVQLTQTLSACPFDGARPRLQVPDRYSTGYSIKLTEVECPTCSTRTLSDSCESQVEQVTDAVRKWNAQEFEPGETEIKFLRRQLQEFKERQDSKPDNFLRNT